MLYKAACSLDEGTTTTISNSDDAVALASSCSTFTGDIAIATGTTDDIYLDGLEEIQGSLYVANVTYMTWLSSDSLVTVSNYMSLQGLPNLKYSNFSQLTTLFSLTLDTLPALQGGLDLDTLQHVSYLSIIGVSTDKVLWHNSITIGGLVIRDNHQLDSIELSVRNASDSIEISSNAPGLNVVMDNLQGANDLTLDGCTNISLSSLTYINETFTLTNNSFTTFNGTPSLFSIKGSLSISGNADLASISMPMLKTIEDGDLSIDNNTNLHLLDFEDLSLVGGRIEMDGSFTRSVPSSRAEVAQSAGEDIFG